MPCEYKNFPRNTFWANLQGTGMEIQWHEQCVTSHDSIGQDQICLINCTNYINNVPSYNNNNNHDNSNNNIDNTNNSNLKKHIRRPQSKQHAENKTKRNNELANDKKILQMEPRYRNPTRPRGNDTSPNIAGNIKKI